jgi:gamma-glutamyltranspeptidase
VHHGSFALFEAATHRQARLGECMFHNAVGIRGIVTAPHNLAAQAGLAVLREGGNAIEAMVAAAAAIAVVYPHMNSLGGDGFWLISQGSGEPVGIDACGAAGRRVEAGLYRNAGHESIPERGPLAANTVAGTVSGWARALEISARWGGKLPLSRLLEDAVHWAEHGFAPSEGQRALTAEKLPELADVSGFTETFLPGGYVPETSDCFRQPRLAETLRGLQKHGCDSFYRGALAHAIAADLALAGSPLTGEDLATHHARVVSALAVDLHDCRVYNLPPPTQGLATLIILGLFDRLGISAADGFDYVHALVECTKQAFLVRDANITDPEFMDTEPGQFLAPAWLAKRARSIERSRALPWPQSGPNADTVWMGAIDGNGRAVSFIQSVYWEFGSGLVLENTGLLWQNRGASFQLASGTRNELRPGRRPFHTLNPSLAQFHDGRTLVFGAMGGEGQPQTQAALFTRYARFRVPLQQAVSAPRWLLGRTWGAQSTTLKLERRFPESLASALREAGHCVELVDEYDERMGHAGAVLRNASGMLEGAADPRGNGCAAAF